tara:strand:+ start:512 stop:1000 length:489 start_codon:yes stop_codon:yes gene_type:complete
MNNMEGIGEYQEKSGVGAFALQSGNSSSLPFKEMGSSPATFTAAAAQPVGRQPTMMENQSNVAEQNTSEVPQHGPEAHMKGKMGGKMWGGISGTSGGQDAFEAMSMKDFGSMEKGARKEYMSGLSKEDKRTQARAFMPKPFGGMGGGGGILGAANMFGGMFG